MGTCSHSLHAVLRLWGQARCKAMSLQIPGPSSKRFLPRMFHAAVGSRWCRVRPQPKGVWQIVMQKQAQGIHSANFFESQVCKLCVCYTCNTRVFADASHNWQESTLQCASIRSTNGECCPPQCQSYVQAHTITQVPADFGAGWAWLFTGQVPGVLQLHLQMDKENFERTRCLKR
jgi:hypothetical protein